MIVVERRASASRGAEFLAYVIALAAGFAVSALLILASGAHVVEAFAVLYEGAFGNGEALLQSLVEATPLMFTGLATVIAFRARVWSIGQEGQMFAGAMAGYWASLYLVGVPSVIALPAIIGAAILGGGLLAAFSGWLKARFDVNEIISTVMLNYVAVYFLSYLLAGGPWTEAGATSYNQTPVLAANFDLPILIDGSKLHIGFLLALIAAALCHVLITRTPLGFELRALGFNLTALRYKGANIGKTIVVVMFISGGLAALAGVSQIFGVDHRLRGDVLTGIGYTGIIVGMIAALTPLGAVIAAFFFGALANGSLYMSVLSDIPASLVPAMQGILLLFFLCASVLVRVRLRWRTATDE